MTLSSGGISALQCCCWTAQFGGICRLTEVHSISSSWLLVNVLQRISGLLWRYSRQKSHKWICRSPSSSLHASPFGSLDLQANLFILVKLSRPIQFCHSMPGCLILQTGSLFLLYLESRAEFSLISIGTRCVPKHTSAARKKLPNKEPDCSITQNIRHCSRLQSSTQWHAHRPNAENNNLGAFLAGLWTATSSHSALRNNWGLITLPITSHLF